MNENSNGAVSAVGGIAAGWASYKYLPKIVQRPYGRYIFGELDKLTKEENNMYWNAAHKALRTSGLQEKGVELINLNSKSNIDSVTQDLFVKSTKNAQKTLNKIMKKQNIPTSQTKTGAKATIQTVTKPRPRWKYILFGPSGEDKLKGALKDVSEGQNAFFHTASKNIYVNNDKMGFSVFHEMGHAVNANSTTGKKILSYGRHFTAFMVPILLATALIKKRKPENEAEPNNVKRKKNFLKDNIGLITFGCLTPTLVEEGLASINGAKLAKNVLNPEQLRKLNITNAKAWSTYFVGAVLASVLAQFAVKIKDKLVEPKQNQQA